jgi:mannobiose 2-epimerase
MLTRRTWCRVLVAPALLPIASARHAGRAQVPASRPDSFDARAMRARVQQALDQNLIPFWFPRSVDTANGGYTVHYGQQGEVLPGGTKMIVTQARMLWLSSRLLRARPGTAIFQSSADAGFAFLRDRMWDGRHGGFFWEVDPAGREVRRADKHLYGQAFGLYALAEYVRATGNRDARALADQLFDRLERTAHDATSGGYRESFTRDWQVPPMGSNGPLGAAPDVKLMNTHLHLLEALTTYVQAGAGALARRRLAELIAIETQAVVRSGWVACTDRYRSDWRPILDDPWSRVSYGHDLENIWLVIDALRALEAPVAPFRDLFVQLFTYSRLYGEDSERGGFFDSGPPRAAADRRGKTWWVQAEALVGALAMLELTRDRQYAESAMRTWTWIDRHQIDWTHGEWHETLQPDGSPRPVNKAHAWKAGYHNGRALLEVLERLPRLA